MAAEPQLSSSQGRLMALALSVPARALREGLLWLVPYLILWSLVILLSEVGRSLSPLAPAVLWLTNLQGLLRDALSPVIWGSVGATLALQRRLPRLPVAFVCVAAGLALESMLAWQHGASARTVYVLAAMLLPLALVPALGRLARWPALRMAPTGSSAGHQVAETLNLVLP